MLWNAELSVAERVTTGSATTKPGGGTRIYLFPEWTVRPASAAFAAR